MLLRARTGATSSRDIRAVARSSLRREEALRVDDQSPVLDGNAWRGGGEAEGDGFVGMQAFAFRVQIGHPKLWAIRAVVGDAKGCGIDGGRWITDRHRVRQRGSFVLRAPWRAPRNGFLDDEDERERHRVLDSDVQLRAELMSKGRLDRVRCRISSSLDGGTAAEAGERVILKNRGTAGPRIDKLICVG